MNSWVGRTVGRVHIDALRATGGMAEVYIGTHTTLHRKVAVKVLRDNFEEHSHALERFRREAVVVGNLRHPNIVQVFDFDLVDSHPYLVMEYIKGPTLLQYLNSLHEKNKRLELPQVARLMSAMTSALQYAHDSGVIHRDIKPGNILLSSRSDDILPGKLLPEDFEPVLTDFGLVRFIASTQHTTNSGAIAGTPAYMSPEQARGELTDGRTDIYSLGIVLYEILAGHLPFEGETTMGVLMKHIHEPPAPVPGLTPSMQSVLDRALAKDVEDRFQTPAEFGEAFMRAAENRADLSTQNLSRTGPNRKATKRSRQANRRQKMAGPVLAVLIVLLAAAVLFMSNIFRATSSPTNTTVPSLRSTDTVYVPSHTAAWTSTPFPTILLGRTGVLQFADGSSVADQAVLTATALLAPPPDSQYEVWLVDDSRQRTSLGILSLDSKGQGKLVFAGEQGANLVGQYSGIEITIEPSPDSDPVTSGIVAYSYYYPQDGIPHLRSLLSASASTPAQGPLIQGLTADVQTINEFAKEMQKSSENGNVDRVRLYAEAIQNIVVGGQSDQHMDWNADGQVDDPSDRFGLLLNGRNLGYLQATYIEADGTANAVGSSGQMATNGVGLKNSVQNLAQWTNQLEELVGSILTSPEPSSIGSLVLQASALTDKMVNGIDLDEDGVVEPVIDEAGVLVAYQQAYRMADMPLQAVGIRNLGTGTPTFILVTSTPGGNSGRGGQTAIPAQNTPPGQPGNTSAPPPGQQKTPKPPPPGQQKTKEPPPGQQKTNKPNAGNTGNNKGNNNNGNSTTPNGVP